MSTTVTMVAATVDQQNSAVALIAEGGGRASGEARSCADSMGRVSGVSYGARATASDGKGRAEAVATEAEDREMEVRRFFADVRAAYAPSEAALTPLRESGAGHIGAVVTRAPLKTTLANILRTDDLRIRMSGADHCQS